MEHRLAQLEAVVASSPDALVALDLDLRVVEWNGAAERMFGWTRDEMLGETIRRVIPPVGRERFEAVLSALRQGRPVPSYEGIRVHRDGSRRAVLVHPNGVRGPSGEIIGTVALLRDLGERQREERRLGDLLESVPVVIARFDAAGVVTYAAGGGYRNADLSPEAVRGLRVLDTTSPGSRIHQAVRAALRGESSDFQTRFEGRLWQCHVAPNGEVSPAQPEHHAETGGGFLSAVDVTTEHEASDRLAEVLAVAPMALTTFDADGLVVHASGSGYAVAGIDPAGTVGRSLLELYGENADIRQGLQDCLRGEARDLVTVYADRLWELHYRPYRSADGALAGGVLIGQDATAWLGEPDRADAVAPPAAVPRSTSGAARREAFLQFLDRDELTGLPGRRGLRRLLSAPARGARVVAVADIDGFALLNETHGPDLADQALRVLGDRVRELGGPAVVGRWHADEFVLVLDEGPGEADLLQVMEELTDRVLAAAREPIRLDSSDIVLSMSAGLASSRAVPGGDLLAAARAAVREAKRGGRDRLEWFQPRMAAAATAAGMVRELGTAITSGEMVLHYQPIVRLDGSRPSSAEALVRWQHPKRGLLAPGEFVETAERTGLIVPLGAWVLREACRVACDVTDDEHGIQSVAVNLSSRQLADPALIDHVAEALEEARCPPSSLVVEVTETAVLADIAAAARTLEELKQLGVQLALDDFGTGYSSLLYLRHFPVDEIKIDRSFVQGLGTNKDDTAIVASTISLAHTMGVTSVAEGVETISQLDLLSQMGCDFAQGYLFSRPLPWDSLQTWLHERAGGAGVLPSADRGPAVERILQMHAEAASLHTIAAALNASGLRTERGSRWSAQAVARVVAQARFPDLERSR